MYLHKNLVFVFYAYVLYCMILKVNKLFVTVTRLLSCAELGVATTCCYIGWQIFHIIFIPLSVSGYNIHVGP